VHERSGGIETGEVAECGYSSHRNRALHPTESLERVDDRGEAPGRHLVRQCLFQRIACRRSKAVRRNCALLRARPASSRARHRSRMASSSPVGTETEGRSPERLRRASGMASRRLVVTRSRAFGGARRVPRPSRPGLWWSGNGRARTRRACLIDKEEMCTCGLPRPDELIEVTLACTDGAKGDDFGMGFLGDVCHGNRLFMDIQSDIKRARLWPG
jgi:hypothetical protein